MPPSPQPSSHRIGVLFQYLKGLYGNRWTSQYQTEESIRLAMAAWDKALEGISDKQIERGMKNIQTEWPPSAPEFRRNCLDSSWEHAGPAYRKFDRVKAIGNEARDETVQIELEKMRNELREGHG